jgi:uncharacterized membrane protein
MAFFISCLSIYLIGLLELWIAIPLGFALKINPFITAFFASIGAISSCIIIILIGVPIRNKFYKTKIFKKKFENKYFQKVWNEFGIFGLGLIAPIFTGVHIGTAIALFWGCSARNTIFYMSIGTIIWTIILTVLTSLGISIVKQ